MSGYSLRTRLFAGVALWSIIALCLAGVGIVLVFSATVQRDQLEDLGASLDQLTLAVASSPQLADPALPDPRYQKPAGDLYYQIVDLDSGQVLRSRSLWDTELRLPDPRAGDAVLTTLPGPAGQTLSLLVRDITTGTPPHRLRIAVAENVELRGHSIGTFASQIAMALLAVAAALLLAAWLVLRLSLSPLDQLRRHVASIASGGASKLEGRYPTEFAPLVDEVNELLEVNERTLRLSRERADDLAHGLKTPLAVIRATAARLRERGDGENASALDLLSTEMADRIDYQMRLSHLRIRSKTVGFVTSVDQMLIRSVAVMRKTGRGAELYWHLEGDRVDADIDPHDLMELVGVILENAGRWAKSEVRVTSSRIEDQARFVVCDDGPGLTEEQIALLGQRGRRLDETRSGSGFGLAIAREITRLNGGTITWRRGAGAGLEVEVRLPAPAAS